MKEFVKKYYLYIGVALITIFALISSLDFEKNPDITIPPKETEQEINDMYIYIDIRGSVLNPGVYKVEMGTRLFQLINLAGGFTDDVKQNVVNQSILLEDEMYIYIPNINDQVEDIMNQSGSSDEKLVNINTASKTELETLTGVGPSTAQSIIDYREDNGEFSSKEDIMNVPGIGESTYNEIKDSITV